MTFNRQGNWGLELNNQAKVMQLENSNSQALEFLAT